MVVTLTVEMILPFLEKRNIKVLLINAQGDFKGLIQEFVIGLRDALPVYIMDQFQKVYGELGIFVIQGFSYIGLLYSYGMYKQYLQYTY